MLHDLQRPPLVVVMRHGKRLDTENSRWHLTASHPWDSPLSEQGQVDLIAVATHVSALQLHNVVLIASPFTRCLQTSAQVLSHLPAGTAATAHVCRSISEVFSAHLLHRTAHHSDVKLMAGLRLWWWQVRRMRQAKALLKAIAASIAPGNTPRPGPASSSRSEFFRVGELTAYPWPQFPESEEEASARYIRTVTALAAQFKGRDMLVVSHGNCVKAWAERCVPGAHVGSVKPGGFLVLQPGPGDTLQLHESLPMSGVELDGDKHAC
ncbi:MAG: hypothetical protein WDW38_004209 [Sanguina aurantia]